MAISFSPEGHMRANVICCTMSSEPNCVFKPDYESLPESIPISIHLKCNMVQSHSRLAGLYCA